MPQSKLKTKTMRKAFFALFLLGMSQALAAQFWVVKGTVQDDKAKPLQAATVVLLNKADSSKRAFSTRPDGTFRITEVTNGSYQLSISFIGFETHFKAFEVANGTVNLNVIQLKVDPKQLDGVTVEGLAQRVVQKGDTVEMNADAYKVNPDANAEDLLEKMPGVVIQNGTVQAQGENVKRVLVDGREFFGDDPNAALKNLPAEIIQKIQVYDEASDQAQFTGFMDGETSKTLNIITRASMRNGEFGKVYAGAGTDSRYNAGGSINLFREKSRTTILGQMNNINIQNFATSDLLGIVAGGGRRGGGRRGGGGVRGGAAAGGGLARGGGRFNNGGDVRDFLVGQQGGISETKAFGINYSIKTSDKLDVQASYFFNQSDNRSDEAIFRQFTLAENEGQTYAENSLVPSRNTNHRISGKIEYKINDRNSLLIRPRLTIQENAGTALTEGITALNGDALNTAINENRNDLMAYNFSNNLLYRHSFEKRGRTFSVNLNTALNQNMGDSWLLSANEFFAGNRETQEFNQFSELDQNGLTLTATATYTEPLTQKSQLMLTYRYGYQFNDSDKETFDFNESDGDFTDLNLPLSNVFENDYITHRAGVGYNLRGTKGTLTLRGNLQWASLDNDQTFPETDNVDRSFTNFLPTLVYRYRFSRTKNLSFVYRANTQAPSVSQLQNVVDNSNPLFISAGNPELDQNYQHTGIVRYTSTDVEKGRTFFALLSMNLSENYIGNSTIIASRGNAQVGDITLQPGAQFFQPVNLKGYRNLRSFVSYGLPVSWLKSNLNLNLSATYTRTPELINNELNFAESPSFGLGWVLSSNISEKVDFTVSSNTSMNLVSNSLENQANSDFLNQNTRLRLNWIFGDGFVFRSTTAHVMNSGLSEGFNQNFVLWNMEVGKKLLKQKGEIKLSVFDLLKENQSISRSITGSYVEDSQTQILTQYFMLSFVYNIRSFGQGASGIDEERLKRFQQMRQRFGGN